MQQRDGAARRRDNGTTGQRGNGTTDAAARRAARKVFRQTRTAGDSCRGTPQNIGKESGTAGAVERSSYRNDINAPPAPVAMHQGHTQADPPRHSGSGQCSASAAMIASGRDQSSVKRSNWCRSVHAKNTPMTRQSATSSALSTRPEGFDEGPALTRTYSRKKT